MNHEDRSLRLQAILFKIDEARTIEEIETLRGFVEVELGIDVSASRLCRRADFNQSHYSRLVRGRHEPYQRTIGTLRRGLRAIVEEAAA